MLTYNKLWNKLAELNMTKTKLRDTAQISNSSLARLTKNQNVTTDVLDRICFVLNVDIGDITEFVKEEGKHDI